MNNWVVETEIKYVGIDIWSDEVNTMKCLVSEYMWTVSWYNEVYEFIELIYEVSGLIFEVLDSIYPLFQLHQSILSVLLHYSTQDTLAHPHTKPTGVRVSGTISWSKVIIDDWWWSACFTSRGEMYMTFWQRPMHDCGVMLKTNKSKSGSEYKRTNTYTCIGSCILSGRLAVFRVNTDH